MTRIAEATSRPAASWACPFSIGHIMKRVELIAHDSADPAVIDAVAPLGRRWERRRILVATVGSPRHGSRHLGLEAMRMPRKSSHRRGHRQSVEPATAPMGPLRVAT